MTKMVSPNGGIIFSIIFFKFPNLYAVSLNLNNLSHLEIYKVKPFFKSFSKLFSNHLEWSKMTKMISPNGGLVAKYLQSKTTSPESSLVRLICFRIFFKGLAAQWFIWGNLVWIWGTDVIFFFLFFIIYLFGCVY